MKLYFKPILLTGEGGLVVEEDDKTFGPEGDEGSMWGGDDVGTETSNNPLQP